MLASKTTYFSINFWCVLASKFHQFLGAFRLPNPLVLGACSITLNIECEKWDFVKICILPRENHYFSGFEHWGDQQIQATIDETTRWKCIENPYVFNHRFYQKSSKFRPKIRSPQAYSKKYQKSRCFDHFGLQNPPKIQPKSIQNRASKKHSIFHQCFFDLFVFFKARNLKNRAPVEAGAQFL